MLDRIPHVHPHHTTHADVSEIVMDKLQKMRYEDDQPLQKRAKRLNIEPGRSISSSTDDSVTDVEVMSDSSARPFPQSESQRSTSGGVALAHGSVESAQESGQEVEGYTGRENKWVLVRYGAKNRGVHYVGLGSGSSPLHTTATVFMRLF